MPVPVKFIATMSHDKPSQVLPWLQPYWQQLSAYRHQHRIPQALLISGNKGLGKQQLASQFAQSLLCSESLENGFFCGQCHACHLFQANTHPDFISLQVEGDGKQISIEQIRNLITQLALKSQYGGKRIVVINQAEQMNRSAANGFLKCLEEPAADTVILLITEQAGRLPLTISSRCQKLHIKKPDPGVALNWLKEQNIIEKQSTLLALAQGSPLLAKHFSEQGIVELRSHCFNDWLNIFSKQANPVSIAETWQQYDEKLLFFWLSSWTIDLIRFSYQKESSFCYNPDLQKQLQQLTQQVNLSRLYCFYDLLLQTQRQFSNQLNKQLLFENILINWSRTNSGG